MQIVGGIIPPCATDTLSAQSAIVIDQNTGQILLYKNEQKRVPPASTTKIMTALVALEKGDVDAYVNVGEEILWTTPGESVAGLNVGEQLLWRHLLVAMLLPSGNDAARTVAVQVGGRLQQNGLLNEEEAIKVCVNRMNERVKRLKLQNTHFVNPHGLHHEEHYSTAYDLAIIAMEAMKNAQFQSIVGQPFTEVQLVSLARNDKVNKTYTNRNRLLLQGSKDYYVGATGIKTGFTDEAGHCLVSSAERQGHRIIAVVLQAHKNRIWSDTRQLLDSGFKKLGL